jgi:FAD/FMN-containing dehydrogenase
VDDNRAIAERVIAAGGTVYPVGALALSEAEWRAHLGPRFRALAAAKRAFDPERVLTPGYPLFPRA